MIKVVGLGAGGHAKVLIEIILQYPEVELVGLLDPDAKLHGTEVLNVKVLGDDNLLAHLVEKGITHFFVGLGGTGNNRPRRKLYEFGIRQGCKSLQVIHSSAIVSPSVSLGDGVEIMAGTIINANARVGSNVIVNSGAVVEHDCRLGDHVHVASGALLASSVTVGDEAHIGTGATIRQCIRIGERVIVGAGAVVVKDVEPDVMVAGVPARPIQRQ